MALSFKSSKESVTNSMPFAAYAGTSMASTNKLATDDIYTSCKDGRYIWYEKYQDRKYSILDSQRGIKLDSSQINLTQEENSQFIPFKIPRFWDGIDLMDMLIQIHYSNKSEEGEIVNVVNVAYSEDTIVFAWLVNRNVTAMPGKVKFELWAVGLNERNENYKWVSKPNEELNVLQSLSRYGVIEPSHDWITALINLVDLRIAEVSQYTDDMKTLIDSNSSDIDVSKTDIVELKTRVIDIESEFDAIEVELTSEKIKISKNQTDITELKVLVGDGYEEISSDSIKALFRK